MKLLYFFVAITVLVAVAVALPAKTEEQIAAEGNQLVEDLVQYAGTRLNPKKSYKLQQEIRGVMCLSLRMLRCNCLLLYCLRWWKGDQFLQR
uniref:U14-Hexatoxin-Hf1m_1 n=1 Tax=Hadronyche formidabilis TaxID=426499 RepID=A0A4Q8K8C4_HADFO